MSNFEKPQSPEQENFEIFKLKYLKVLQNPDVPDVYKVFLSQVDIVMLLGKLKPMTEFQVQEENLDEFTKRGYWQDNSLEAFLDLLKNELGVEHFEDFREGKNALYRIYDPEQIRAQVKKFPKLLAWDDTMKLNEWIDANLDAGVPIDYVKGALYGFPQSSIDFYLDKQGLMDVEYKGIGTYGEDYGVPPGKLSADVITREKTKKKFFDRYYGDQEIQGELVKTDQLKEELIQIRQEISKKKDAQDERLK